MESYYLATAPNLLTTGDKETKKVQPDPMKA